MSPSPSPPTLSTASTRSCRVARGDAVHPPLQEDGLDGERYGPCARFEELRKIGAPPPPKFPKWNANDLLLHVKNNWLEFSRPSTPTPSASRFLTFFSLSNVNMDRVSSRIWGSLFSKTF